jgi:hypothetical protein
MKKYGMSLFALLFAILFTGCNNYVNIPAGFIGKILTPTGWTKGIIEAGQVDLGTPSDDNQSNSLSILEATSVSIKESYLKNEDSKGNIVDDRIAIGGPTTVDVYVRMKVPSDERSRDGIFSQITPASVDAANRTSVITVETIYSKLARMDVRSAIRQVLSKYKDVDSVRAHQDKVNDELGVAVIAMFKRSGVPLELQNVVISNIQPDPAVLEAKNKQLAAQSEVATIDSIGAALKRNPQYLIVKKYQTYENVASKGATMVMIDGQDNGRFTIPLK